MPAIRIHETNNFHRLNTNPNNLYISFMLCHNDKFITPLKFNHTNSVRMVGIIKNYYKLTETSRKEIIALAVDKILNNFEKYQFGTTNLPAEYESEYIRTFVTDDIFNNKLSSYNFDDEHNNYTIYFIH